MKIITLTLNPAFDIHCYSDAFVAGKENLAVITSSDAGGKGINISRSLFAGGIESLALVVLGDENGDSFVKALGESGFDLRAIEVCGRIRENITVHTSHSETRLSFSGFLANDTLLDRAFCEIESELTEDAVVTFTGRVPNGISTDAVKGFINKIKNRGARLVIDSKSFTLSDIIDTRPWLIKPNQEEISEYLGREITDFVEAKTAAEELRSLGMENVMISLGEKGAMLACREGIYIATPLEIAAVSTIGAGDSAIAGFLVGESKGMGPDGCLALGVAYGTAACLTEGTKPPVVSDISRILDSVTVSQFM